MNTLNLSMKTDYETLMELIGKFNETETNRADKMTILKDLEFYVHQVNNQPLMNYNSSIFSII
jgi:hypothetical protein